MATTTTKSKDKGVPPSPEELLKSDDAEAVASYIKSEYCKNIFIMAGAGISTAAGIPDFRSPETGLYANLARLELPFPEAVFEINYFRRNPLPFYTLAHELAPGRYRPTLTHSFIKLLNDEGLLHTHFTQNIDTLERRAGLPDGKIIEAHGSFATSKCIDCRRGYPNEKMNEMIKKKEIPKCKHCRGLVKPDIVFFGEALPPQFHRSILTLAQADLLIVMGTSLTVHPFASLTDMVPRNCPRVLINLEPVGDLGGRSNDILLLGHSDQIVEEICRHLGWADKLKETWAETATSLDKEYLPGVADLDASSDAKPTPPKSKGKEPLAAKAQEDSLQALTDKIESSLHLNDNNRNDFPGSSKKEPEIKAGQKPSTQHREVESPGHPSTTVSEAAIKSSSGAGQVE